MIKFPPFLTFTFMTSIINGSFFMHWPPTSFYWPRPQETVWEKPKNFRAMPTPQKPIAAPTKPGLVPPMKTGMPPPINPALAPPAGLPMLVPPPGTLRTVAAVAPPMSIPPPTMIPQIPQVLTKPVVAQPVLNNAALPSHVCVTFFLVRSIVVFVSLLPHPARVVL